MAKAVDFGNLCINTAQTVTSLMAQIQTINERITEDNTLAAAAAQALNRSDLVTADITNFNAALAQLLFTFNSGSPTQRNFIFKLL